MARRRRWRDPGGRRPSAPAAAAAPVAAPPPARRGRRAAAATPANAPTGNATNASDDVIRDARDAFQRHDRARLALLRATALTNRLPLAPWVDYWELTNRLSEVSADEVEQFYARWPGTYVEDRLRNDWLLEVGHRRDWDAFKRDYPRFRMNDDRSVTCYATLIDHLAGKEVHDAALAQWLAMKDIDGGCQLMAQTLHDDKVFTDADVWRRMRQAAELSGQAGRARDARRRADPGQAGGQGGGRAAGQPGALHHAQGRHRHHAPQRHDHDRARAHGRERPGRGRAAVAGALAVRASAPTTRRGPGP